MTYEEIVQKWQKAKLPANIFSGNLLTVLTSEISKIEGINVSYHRTHELLENEYVAGYTGDIRDLFSVLNNRTLADFYNNALKDGQKITPWFIKKSHEILLKASIDKHRYHDNGERAGQYKKHDYCIGVCDTGTEPAEVESQITELCELLEERKDSNTLELAAVFHCLFESIHPFADGNGRVGRWLLNYLLVSRNHPPVIIMNDNKEDYYLALEEFDRTEDPLPMYDFLKSQVVNQYHLLRPMLEDTSMIDALWSEVPPSIRDNYTGDREVLLRELGLLG